MDKQKAIFVGNGRVSQPTANLDIDGVDMAVGVLAALRERRVYATSGPRILLRATLAGRPMGAAVPAAAVADGGDLRVRVVSPGEIQQVEVIRSGSVAHIRSGEGRRELDLELELDDLGAGEYVYVRAILYGSATAWSSPFFVE